MSRAARRMPPAEGCGQGSRGRGDEGAALIEFSIIAPLLLILLFGILEFGLVFRDTTTVSDAINDAARSGAIAGPDWGALDDDPAPVSGAPPLLANATADFLVMKRLRQALGPIPVDWVKRIVIFKAGDPTSGSPEEQLSEACKSGTGSTGVGPDHLGACNVYDPEAAFRAYEAKDVAYFNCEQRNTSPECNWRSRSRMNDPVNPSAYPNYPGPDYLGVYVQIERPYLTGIFGKTFDFEDAAIVRLEPGLEQN